MGRGTATTPMAAGLLSCRETPELPPFSATHLQWVLLFLFWTRRKQPLPLLWAVSGMVEVSSCQAEQSQQN